MMLVLVVCSEYFFASHHFTPVTFVGQHSTDPGQWFIYFFEGALETESMDHNSGLVFFPLQNPAGSTESQRTFAFSTISHAGIARMTDERA